MQAERNSAKKRMQKRSGYDIVASEAERGRASDDGGMTEIDYPGLMDLRVDYAFKLMFSSGGAHRLICLLNAIFENKKIPRVVTGLTIENPILDRASLKDKLSVLDLRVRLDDGTSASVEMHLYDLMNHKFKTLRSWARIFGEDLKAGEDYARQNPVICISLINGPITNSKGRAVRKIHSLFKVMERDSHEVLMDAMELHYINMRAFVRHCREKGKPETGYDRFTRWMMLITHKMLRDGEALKSISGDDEIGEAMRALTRLSSNKIKRQAYQRRLDELRSYNSVVREIAEKDAVIADKDAVIMDKDAALADKDAAHIAEIADKDAIIAQLKAQLGDN